MDAVELPGHPGAWGRARLKIGKSAGNLLRILWPGSPHAPLPKTHDLLVVQRAPSDSREKRSRIAESLGDLEFPVDVFVIATERFEESKNIFGGIAYPAHKYGRVIYQAT